MGKSLAVALKLPFTDTDTALEKEFQLRTGKNADCRSIFREYGEEYFRKLEADTIRSLCGGCPQVFALGGGTASNPFLSEEELKALGCWIYLEIAPEIAYRRILHRGLPPLLKDADDPQKAFLELYEKRTPRFRELADMTYVVREGLSPLQQTEELLKKLREDLKI